VSLPVSLVHSSPTAGILLPYVRDPVPPWRLRISSSENNSNCYCERVIGTYTIVDEWCSGFLQGIALAGDAWQPLLDEKPDILRPFQLFATPEGWSELDAAVDGEAMHAEWSGKIAPTVRAIHAYWLPYREASATTLASPRPRKIAAGRPKVGRNAPCPCGSGKKYKYFCDSSGALH
jgi:uncharacterized protein YecA (UPF0149 family)